MATARRHLVDDSQSGVYHCVSRCVQQAFLFRNDRIPRTPDDPPHIPDDHRREWVFDRLRLLVSVFAVDCASVAVMSNHLHLLLRTLPEVVDAWSDAEVAYRWRMVHPDLRWRRAQGIDPAEPPRPDEVARLLANASRMATCRARLSSLSWFMKELKEWLSRRCNREIGRSGAFWEERFTSQQVLDDDGLVACASYIDLNPVAARMADDPLSARFTSVEAQARRMDDEARELWRRIATAQATGAGASLDDVESFLALLGDAMFSPAMPARREPHGVADTWGLDVAVDDDRAQPPASMSDMPTTTLTTPQDLNASRGTRVAPCVAPPIRPEAAPRALEGGQAPSPPPTRSDATGRAAAIPYARTSPRHPPRKPPPVELCAVRHADYLRRLVLLADLARAGGDAKRETRRKVRREANRGSRRAGRRGHDGQVGHAAHAAGAGRDMPSTLAEAEASLARENRLARAADLAAISRLAVELTREAPTRAVELLAAMLASPRTWGSAIGTPESCAEHARRRGVKRVVMALR